MVGKALFWLPPPLSAALPAPLMLLLLLLLPLFLLPPCLLPFFPFFPPFFFLFSLTREAPSIIQCAGW
jgi:hypothetical protein